MRRTPISAALVSACCTFAICGCGGNDGPEMGEVSGVVKLDGQPLPKATVRFIPENGAPSVAITDEQGWYELQYSSSRSGAVVGRHTVRITTHRSGGESEEGTRTPAVPENVPAEYNAKSADNPDMQKDVQPGSNEIHFELKSGGEIVQPASD